MNLRQQKYLILFLIGSLNFSLIYTFILFNKVWYAYLGFLLLASLLNGSASILNICFRIFNPSEPTYRIEPRNYIYVIPCYNESELELRSSLHSLIEQRVVKNDKRLIVIICDGKVRGAGNAVSTDRILLDLLQIKDGDVMRSYQRHDYDTWDGTKNIIHTYSCDYTYHNETLPILLLIKENNYGNAIH
jgi:chitin synthase